MPKAEAKTIKKLNIIIVGCGKVGRTVVEQLHKEGHNITIIEKDPIKLAQITNMYDVMGVEGNGASYNIQMEAGIESTDLLIAVTGSDELNLLCCTIAKRASDCSAIARVRTPDYSREVAYLQEKLGLAMIINPELEAAREIVSILSLPSALEVNSFAHGQAEMIEFEIPKDNLLDGITLFELTQKMTVSALVTCVKRENAVHIPSGGFILRAGDIVSIVGARRFAKVFLNDIGINTRQVTDCLIIGGGKSAYYLAASLLSNGVSVKLIEQDEARCSELSVLLPKAIIIHGDGSDENLLMEEGLQHAESFVPLTGIDEQNILLTLFANQVSKAKVVTKVNRINFKGVIGDLDLGSIVYPKYIASEAIVAYVRAKSASSDKNIETLYHLFDQQVEAIEFNVTESSNATSTPLSKMRLKKNVLVSFINRNGKIIIPSGSDSIEIGDTVMIVTTEQGFKHITDILD